MLFHFLTLTDPQREREISERSRSARERERERHLGWIGGGQEREREVSYGVRCKYAFFVELFTTTNIREFSVLL